MMGLRCFRMTRDVLDTMAERWPTANRNRTPPAPTEVDSELTPIADARCSVPACGEADLA
jgi:hypothetical protein